MKKNKDFVLNNNIFSGNITRHPPFREYFQEFKNSDKIWWVHIYNEHWIFERKRNYANYLKKER